MSLTDDIDFDMQLVEQTAQIIGTEVRKLQSQLTKDRKERQQLQERVKSLETELEAMKTKVEQCQFQQCVCVCRQTVYDALSAALMTVASVVPQNPQHSLSSFEFTATPIDTTATPEFVSEIVVEPRSMDTSMGSLKMESTSMESHTSSKKARPQATSQIFNNLDQIPADLKDKITPFFKIDKQASQDKLNDVQRAFVKFKTQQLLTAGDSLNAAVVDTVIKEGIEERLWESDFRPRDNEKFETYLLSRMKNERKALRKRESLKGQRELVDKYLLMQSAETAEGE